MFRTMDQSTARYIPLLRSFRNVLSARIYEHFRAYGTASRQKLAQKTRSCELVTQRTLRTRRGRTENIFHMLSSKLIAFVVFACLPTWTTSLTVQRNGPQDVDAGGHRLHMVLQGRSGPTVVLESGLGQGREVWVKVLSEVANFTRVVAYDRAGLGQSEPGPKPRTAQQIATELHTALKSAGLAPPYVLVGHSGSGFTIRVFASMYQKEVAGLVFVDPTQEGLTEWLKSHQPEVWKQLEAEQEKTSEGVRDEFKAADTSQKQAQAAGPLPDVPVILLTGMSTDNFRTPELLAVWLNLHKEWLKKIPHGKHVLAQNSGHFIQTSEPELVVNAIREIVEGVRQKSQRF
jgi:pimeloyl-ACP methyl ester carboxylesterase